jgi:hypothetical protein
MDSADKNFERIIKWAQKVSFYSQSDPETALIHARRTSEAICKDVHERKLGTLPPLKDFNELIGKMKKDKLIPGKIESTLRVIQNFGNFTVHADEEDISELVSSALNFFPNILDWYFQEHKATDVPNEVRFREVLLDDLFITPNLVYAYCIFGFETDGGRGSELWKNPFRFHEILHDEKSYRQRFEQWLRMKRKFSTDEILHGKWIKVADHGYQHRLQFLEDGTLREWSLFSFDEDDFWTGTWILEDGVLKTHIKGFEEVAGEQRRDEVGYHFEAIAGRNGFHSAVENRNNVRSAYFRFFHVCE